MKQFKQKPLSQARQQALRAALKGVRGDATCYVTRKVTKPAIGDNANFSHPLKVRGFKVDTLDLNEWHNNREGMLAVIATRRWNGERMA